MKWELPNSTFKTLIHQYGLFGSHFDNKLEKFITRTHTTRGGQDAFSVSWNKWKINIYRSPPPNTKLLLKICLYLSQFQRLVLLTALQNSSPLESSTMVHTTTQMMPTSSTSQDNVDSKSFIPLELLTFVLHIWSFYKHLSPAKLYKNSSVMTRLRSSSFVIIRISEKMSNTLSTTMLNKSQESIIFESVSFSMRDWLGHIYYNVAALAGPRW